MSKKKIKKIKKNNKKKRKKRRNDEIRSKLWSPDIYLRYEQLKEKKHELWLSGSCK